MGKFVNRVKASQSAYPLKLPAKDAHNFTILRLQKGTAEPSDDASGLFIITENAKLSLKKRVSQVYNTSFDRSTTISTMARLTSS